MRSMMENIEIDEGKVRVQQDVPGTKKVLYLANERNKTNFRFILSMGIFLVLWLGIAAFAAFSTKFDNSFNLGNGITNKSISEARWIVFQFGVLTASMCLSYIVLLRRFAKAIVYATLSLFCLLLLAAVSTFSYFTMVANKYHGYYELYLTGLIILSIMLVHAIIIIVIVRKKIQNAVEVMRVVSKIVVSFPSALAFAILPCALYGIVMVFSQRTWNFLLTEYEQHENDYIFFFHFINIFGFLWFMAFISGWSQTVLSGSFCTWYSAMHKKNVTKSATIFHFIGITIRYHLGTIACGSLMMILRKLIRLLLNTFGRIYVLFGCYNSLFGTLEKYMMYINHNAYIITSRHGTEYFTSAKNAFNILTKNISDVVVITRVAETILILGQFLIIFISALATYGYCKWNDGPFDDPTAEALLLVIISGIVITISIFMVLKVAIDSMYLCVLEDNQINGDANDKPHYLVSDLKALFLENS